MDYLLVSTHAPLCQAETEHACQETHVLALCIAFIQSSMQQPVPWCAPNRDKPRYMCDLGALGACSGCRPTATAATTHIGSLTLLVVLLQDVLQRYRDFTHQPQPVPPLFLELHERPLRGNKKPAFWRCLAGAIRPKKLLYPPLDAAEALDITGMNLQKGWCPALAISGRRVPALSRSATLRFAYRAFCQRQEVARQVAAEALPWGPLHTSTHG